MKKVKIKVEDVLFAFYGSVDVFLVETGELIGNFVYPPVEYLESGKHFFETEDGYDDDLSLSKYWDKIQEVVNENKDKYENVKITEDICRDGYASYRRIVGVRQETDEEYQVRLNKYEEYIKFKKQEKQRRKDEAIDSRRKMLDKLKKEFGEK